MFKVKHAFITRFNDLRSTVYTDYKASLEHDMSQTREAFSDPSDLVARRIGFIPLPLGVAMGRVLCTTITPSAKPINIALFILSYFILVVLRVIISLVILGKATILVSNHEGSNDNETFKKPSSSKNSESSHGDINNTNLTMPMFSNSAVSLNNVCLNDALLENEENIKFEKFQNNVEDTLLPPKNVVRAGSEPLLSQ